MKKILIEIIRLIIIYAIVTIYGYYNDDPPWNKYSWLTSAILIIIIYPIIKISLKKIKRKNDLSKILLIIKNHQKNDF